MVWAPLHNVFVAVDGLLILALFDEGMTDVLEDFETHLFGGGWDDVQGHTVHLDGVGVFLLLEVDVAHVHAQSAGVLELFRLYDLGVFRQGLLDHAIGLEAYREVEESTVGKIEVDHVHCVGRLTELSQSLFFVDCFFGFLETLAEITWIT